VSICSGFIIVLDWMVEHLGMNGGRAPLAWTNIRREAGPDDRRSRRA
jgi:hypothetical protein